MIPRRRETKKQAYVAWDFCMRAGNLRPAQQPPEVTEVRGRWAEAAGVDGQSTGKGSYAGKSSRNCQGSPWVFGTIANIHAEGEDPWGWQREHPGKEYLSESQRPELSQAGHSSVNQGTTQPHSARGRLVDSKEGHMMPVGKLNKPWSKGCSRTAVAKF